MKTYIFQSPSEDYNIKFENLIEETHNLHKLNSSQVKCFSKKSFCNLLIAIFKMKRRGYQHTNIHSLYTNISKSLLIKFYIVKFKTGRN